ncbi:hypothetical protein DFH11DRAFT_1571519 [Phellopilus nigrolimitatus]|nr:hypothetical protein DFH11DRAFT_1571519 [Phellopilus nigrolimitatus]
MSESPQVAKEIHLKQESSSLAPRVKPAPDASAIPVPFVYAPSDDGTDENLLILLHGLGDTHVPFGKLGKQLRLPQTATLALRAPQQIPYLYEEAYQWYPSFDDLGEPIVRPNPAPGVSLLSTAIAHLTTTCAWRPAQIHLFGFAQGGSVALEAAVAHWKARPRLPEADAEKAHALGSAVSVGGPLLLHHAISTACATPALVLHRAPPSALALGAGDRAALARLFVWAKEVELAVGESMPASREEWEPVMEFWSQRLGKRTGEGLYEVLGGTAV